MIYLISIKIIYSTKINIIYIKIIMISILLSYYEVKINFFNFKKIHLKIKKKFSLKNVLN